MRSGPWTGNSVRPYYEQSGVTIYHGDCRDVIEQWEGLRAQTFDLLLTDPPYGLSSWSASGGGGRDHGSRMSALEFNELTRWDERVEPETLARLIALARCSIIWGGNYYGDALGTFRSPLVWDKGLRGLHFADGELAWTNFSHGTLRIFGMSINSGDMKGQRVHPTQKPEALMVWAIRQSKHAQTILDPFMGSGTTLVAAKRLGRTVTGIDINERYCEIAARRLQQEALPLEAVSWN